MVCLVALNCPTSTYACADYMQRSQLTVKAIHRMFNGDIGERITGRDKQTCILRALDQLDQHPQLVTRLRLHCASKDVAGYMSERHRSGSSVMRQQGIHNIPSHQDGAVSGEHGVVCTARAFITPPATLDWCRGSSPDFVCLYNYLCLQIICEANNSLGK
jgi:hypothetical protein